MQAFFLTKTERPDGMGAVRRVGIFLVANTPDGSESWLEMETDQGGTRLHLVMRGTARSNRMHLIEHLGSVNTYFGLEAWKGRKRWS